MIFPKQMTDVGEAPVHILRLKSPGGSSKTAGFEDPAEHHRVPIAVIFDRKRELAEVSGLTSRHVRPLTLEQRGHSSTYADVSAKDVGEGRSQLKRTSIVLSEPPDN
jgi:hypothetical protein